LHKQNIKPEVYSIPLEERSIGTGQDTPSSISSNETATLDTPQQFCFSLQNMKQLVNTSMARM